MTPDVYVECPCCGEDIGVVVEFGYDPIPYLRDGSGDPGYPDTGEIIDPCKCFAEGWVEEDDIIELDIERAHDKD
jgi:hypothetical protein